MKTNRCFIIRQVLFSCLLIFPLIVDAQEWKNNPTQGSTAKPAGNFRPGQIWPDNEGNHINAHGGGILFHRGMYYWFGEHKAERSSNALVGVTCYSSADLYNWKYEGVALPVVKDNPDHEITEDCVLERPKVIYNAKTKKFVMYFHLELKGKGYEAARVGIAVADRVTGPYTFLKSYRPNAGSWPVDMSEADRKSTVKPSDFTRSWTNEWVKAVVSGMYTRRDFEGGQMSRDMTLFVDDDGKAYHLYASEENYTLNLAELSDDYLSHTGKYIRIAPAGHNEAPAIFRKDGVYFLITSGCTGWDPNAARLFTANAIWGPWTQYPNPCVGSDADLTFHSQSTYILPVQGRKNAFIFMADRWTPRMPINARYIWLPIRFHAGLPVLQWLNEWNLSIFDTLEEPNPALLNNQWKFRLGDMADAQSPALKDDQWQTVDLPHDWSIKMHPSPTLGSATGYLPGGIGWYRKSIYIPASKQGEKVFLYFEGVYNRSQIFVNGKKVGERPSGYASFEVDISPAVAYGKENLIAVRVDHSKYIDSRWYTGSGIYRDVWLKYTHPVHIAQWGVFAYPKEASRQNGRLSVEVSIDNDSKETTAVTIRHELFSPAGKPVAKSDQKLNIRAGNKAKVTADLKVSAPSLWSTETPSLYRLETTVLQGNKVIDKAVTTTGFRQFTFDPDKGFALNGKWMKVKGVCLHHDGGVFGAAVPKEIWERRLTTLKALGCNAVRCSHNPQAPDFYDLCDRLGLLVMDEAFDEWESPKRKWIEGWNVGTPGYDGIVDFFAEWGEKDLADMVRRDRNHISIFTWSIGNEIDYPNDPYSHPILDGNGKEGFTQPIFGGYKKEAPNAMRLGEIAKKLAAVVKQHDTSRPVTAALAGVAMSNETEYPGALDIAGYNYTESRYAADHAKYPRRIIYGSENRHSLDAWKAVTDNDYIFGQFLWTGADYLGESGVWPVRGSTAGLIDLGGYVKPRGYFRQSLWADKPMVYIGSYPLPAVTRSQAGSPLRLSTDAPPLWNYEAGQTIRVVCYSNAPKVRLELNGRPVGEVKTCDPESGVFHWDVPYSPGKLVATGLDNEGKEIARHEIQTSKQPDALTIHSVEKTGNIWHITVQVTDEDGKPVLLSDNEVTCTLSGPAKLLGLESGNPRDMNNHARPSQRVYSGRLMAYVQVTEGEGPVKIAFTSPWLKKAEYGD